MDTSCSARRFVVVEGGKICQIDLSPFPLFSNFDTFKRWIKFTSLRVYTYFFTFLSSNPCSIMYVWPYFQTWLPFLVIRRSKVPILHQKLSLFLAIKDHLWMIFDRKRADFTIL